MIKAETYTLLPRVLARRATYFDSSLQGLILSQWLENVKPGNISGHAYNPSGKGYIFAKIRQPRETP
jgi:hypothetical protein